MPLRCKGSQIELNTALNSSQHLHLRKNLHTLLPMTGCRPATSLTLIHEKKLFSLAHVLFSLFANAQWTNTSSDIHNTHTGNAGIGTITEGAKLRSTRIPSDPGSLVSSALPMRSEAQICAIDSSGIDSYQCRVSRNAFCPKRSICYSVCCNSRR